MPKKKIEIILPATIKFSSLVRQISEDVFSYVGFTDEWANRLKLVVDELFMNANRYASIENESKIYIQYEYDEHSIAFTIEDEGSGDIEISAEDLMKKINKNKLALNDLTKTCGRGLALISDLWTDELVISNSSHGGISVLFTKAISSELPPAPPMLKVPEVSRSLEKKVSPVDLKAPAKVIKISGEIDQSNMNEKIKPVESQIKSITDGEVLVIDCSELIYFNSTFIGHLADWHNIMMQKGGQLVLKNTNSRIQDILKLVGLSRVIYIENKI